MPDKNKDKQIFIAYASKDEEAYKTLMRQLEVLAKGVPIETWGKAELMPGSITQEATQAKLKSADILLLLVSADLLTSELYLNFQSQVQASTAVVPVLLRPCAWENDDFLKNRQALPKSEKFISLASDKDEVYTEIVREIKKMVVGKADDKPFVPPVNESPFWKKNVLISLVAVLVLVGIWWGATNLFDSSNPSLFTKDNSRLKILIIRFEDNLNEEDDTYCIGRSIRKNLINLEVNKGLPITSFYADSIASPEHPDEAEDIQKRHNADVLMYGLANKIQENCTAANVCFRHIIANTIVRDSELIEDTKQEKHNMEYETISHTHIEEGKLSVDEQSMEAWVTGLVALKRDDKETYFEEIEKMAAGISHLTKEEQADKFYNQGKVYYGSKDYKKAIASYTKAIESMPNDIKYLRAKAKCYHDWEKYEKSTEVYFELLKISPDDLGAHLSIGDNFKHVEELRESLKYLDKAMKLKPDNAITYNCRGFSYSKLEEYEKAIIDYSRAIELKPDYVKAYVNRGNTYEKLEEYNEAILDYDKAIELNPKYATAYGSRGVSYQYLKEYEKAILDYDKAIELEPNLATAYSNRGTIYAVLNDYKKAISGCDKAIELNPDNAEFYQNRGSIYSDLKNYHRAIADYDKAIELKPDFVEVYNSRGICYHNLGKYKRAISNFNVAIKIKPHAYYYNNHGHAHLKLYQPREAKKSLKKSQKLDPKNSWLYRNWSIYHTTQKDFPKALKNLQKAIDLGYNDKKFLQEEELLDPLRSHPEFKRILDSMDDENSKSPL